MRRDEQNLQIAVVQHLRLCLLDPACFYAVPNGGYRTAREASLMKATGVRAGVPDLVVMWPGHCGGMELKAPKGRRSPEQEAWRLLFLANGHRWAECRSLEQVDTTLRQWGVPMREATIMGKAA